MLPFNVCTDKNPTEIDMLSFLSMVAFLMRIGPWFWMLKYLISGQVVHVPALRAARQVFMDRCAHQKLLSAYSMGLLQCMVSKNNFRPNGYTYSLSHRSKILGLLCVRSQILSGHILRLLDCEGMEGDWCETHSGQGLFLMPTVLAEGKSDLSMGILAGGAQLQIEDFCGNISELLWVLLWPGLRRGFNREMGGDQIIWWRSQFEWGMHSGSVGENCKMILDSEKSRFCLSFLCFIHLICLSGMGKFASGEIKFAMFHISEDM